MQNDFLTKLKITCIRIISFSQKNNFQSINEYYPLVSNFRIKQNFDRNQESFESQDSFQPLTHPLLSVAKFCQRKNSAPGASLEQRERKSERERERARRVRRPIPGEFEAGTRRRLEKKGLVQKFTVEGGRRARGWGRQRGRERRESRF